jgi:type I restriction enzyme R subunit
MALIAKSTQKTTIQKMTHAQLIELISSNANLMQEREDIIAYINSLKIGEVLNEEEIRAGFQAFKAQKAANDLIKIAERHSLQSGALQAFVNEIMGRMIFDGEQLTDVLAPLELGWKARSTAELALMKDLVPYLHKLAGGREISGLNAYE